MNRNIGCSIAAVLMIITMLATGCRGSNTAGNTGRTKVDVAASATSGATAEDSSATDIADTAATDSGNTASTAEETEETEEIPGYYVSLQFPKELASLISWDAYASEGEVDITYLTIRHKESSAWLCSLTTTTPDALVHGYWSSVSGGHPAEYLCDFYPKENEDNKHCLFRSMPARMEDVRVEDSGREEVEMLLEALRTYTEPERLELGSSADTVVEPVMGEERYDCVRLFSIGSPAADYGITDYESLLSTVRDDIRMNYGKGTGEQNVSLPVSRFLLSEIDWTGNPLDKLMTAYHDLDGDGGAELLIGEVSPEDEETGPPYRVYAILTQYNGEVYLADFTPENTYFLLTQDGTVEQRLPDASIEENFVLEQGKLRAVSADGRDPTMLHPEFMPLSTESEDGTDTDSGNAAGADDFIGIYQGMDGGPSCNIWEQSTGLMIGGSLAIGSDYYGSAEYSDGKLYFDFTDEISGKSYQGEIEKTQDGIRMTITGTDDANVPAGSVKIIWQKPLKYAIIVAWQIEKRLENRSDGRRSLSKG